VSAERWIAYEEDEELVSGHLESAPSITQTHLQLSRHRELLSLHRVTRPIPERTPISHAPVRHSFLERANRLASSLASTHQIRSQLGSQVR
jgi:hypothetical protein